MEKLKFRDLKHKVNFETEEYEVTTQKTSRGIKYLAHTISSQGTHCFRLITKAVYNSKLDLIE